MDPGFGHGAVARDRARPGDARPHQALPLRQFPGLLTFTSNGGLLQLEVGGVTGVPMFTAIDCAAAFAAQLPGMELKRVTLDGAELFHHVAALGGMNVHVNMVGPGFRCVLPPSTVAAVVG